MTPWKRTYWAVFVSNLMTAVGMMSFLPFFPTIVEGLGVADDERFLWTGVLFGAAPLASTFMAPVWGSIGDRYGRKLMVVRSMLAIAVFVGFMGLARDPWTLLFLRLGQGLFSGFIPPSVTLVSIATPRELQGRVTGTLQAALPAGMIIGPLAAPHVIEAFGVQGLFAFVAILASTSALLVGLFAHEDASLRLTVEGFSPLQALGHAVRDLRELVQKRQVRWALFAVFAVQLGVGATSPLLELLVESLDVEAASRQDLTSWLVAAYAVAGLLSTPIWGRVGDRAGHARTLLAAGLVSAVVLGLHAAVAGIVSLFLCRVALGAISPATNVTAFGVAATETRHDNRGGALGAVFSARTLAVSVGSFGGGALAAELGLRTLFVAVAGAIVVLLLAVRRPGEPAPGPTGEAA